MKRRPKIGERVRLTVAEHPGTGKAFRVQDYDGRDAVVMKAEPGRYGLVTVMVDGHWLYLDRANLC